MRKTGKRILQILAVFLILFWTAVSCDIDTDNPARKSSGGGGGGGGGSSPSPTAPVIPGSVSEGILTVRNAGQALAANNIIYIRILKEKQLVGSFSETLNDDPVVSYIKLKDTSNNVFTKNGGFMVELRFNLDTVNYISYSELIIFTNGCAEIDLLNIARLQAGKLVIRNIGEAITTESISKLNILQDDVVIATFDSTALVEIIGNFSYITLVDTSNSTFRGSGTFEVDLEISPTEQTYLRFNDDAVFDEGSAAIDVEYNARLLKSHLTVIGLQSDLTFPLLRRLKLEDNNVVIGSENRNGTIISGEDDNFFVPLIRSDGKSFTGTGRFYVTLEIKYNDYTIQTSTHIPVEFVNGSGALDISNATVEKIGCLIITNCPSTFPAASIQVASVSDMSSPLAGYNGSDNVDVANNKMYIPLRAGSAMFSNSGYYFVTLDVIYDKNPFQRRVIDTPDYMSVLFTEGSGTVDYAWLVSNGYVQDSIINNEIVAAPVGTLLYTVTGAQNITLQPGIYCFEVLGGAGIIPGLSHLVDDEFSPPRFQQEAVSSAPYSGGHGGKIIEIIGFDDSFTFTVRGGALGVQLTYHLSLGVIDDYGNYDGPYYVYIADGGGASSIVCSALNYSLAAGGGGSTGNRAGLFKSWDGGLHSYPQAPVLFIAAGSYRGTNGGSAYGAQGGFTINTLPDEYGVSSGRNNRDNVIGGSYGAGYVKIYQISPW